jgi:hypothetical protein
MNQEKEAQNSWSYSQSKLFEMCPRAFYYQKICSSRSNLKLIPQRAIIGISVHIAISTLMDDWVSNKRISYLKIKNVGEQFIKDICNNPKCHITEISNGIEFDKNNIQKFLSVTNSRIKSFYRMIWPRFQSQTHVSHEELDRFKLDNIQIFVKVDLCTRDIYKKLIITDWKLDKSSIYNRDYSQLYIYSLWANKILNEDFSNILLQIININSGETIKLIPTLESTQMIIKKIKQDCGTWSRSTNIVDYKTNAEYHNCISCAFLSECNEGKTEFLNKWKYLMRIKYWGG